MEKINTPLMMAIENINSKIEELEKFTDHENPFPIVRHAKREACMELINFRDQVLKPLLQPELYVIEKFYEKGKHYRSHISFNDQFTQTFKSYEET